MTQEPVIRPMVKKSLVCYNTERIPEFIDMAFRTATSGRPGPVYLEIPVDVLNAQTKASGVKKPCTQGKSFPVDLEKAGQILDMIGAGPKACGNCRNRRVAVRRGG